MTDHYHSDPESIADDLLIGAAAIAYFLYKSTSKAAIRRVYHLKATSQIPISKMGSRYTAFRPELIAYLKRKT